MKMKQKFQPSRMEILWVEHKRTFLILCWKKKRSGKNFHFPIQHPWTAGKFYWIVIQIHENLRCFWMKDVINKATLEFHKWFQAFRRRQQGNKVKSEKLFSTATLKKINWKASQSCLFELIDAGAEKHSSIMLKLLICGVRVAVVRN